MADMKRIGFGQVEPNHLSAQRTSQIYAQLPATGIDILENGQYVKYNYPEGKVDFTGKGEWMMVFNEVKLYDDAWREMYKDYAMKKANFTEGVMTPRVIKTNIGDIYTTNCIKAGNTDGKKEMTMTGQDLKAKDLLKVNAQGFLEKALDDGAKEPMLWEVIKRYTLADGQEAVKIMRIK